MRYEIKKAPEKEVENFIIERIGAGYIEAKQYDDARFLGFKISAQDPKYDGKYGASVMFREVEGVTFFITEIDIEELLSFYEDDLKTFEIEKHRWEQWLEDMKMNLLFYFEDRPQLPPQPTRQQLLDQACYEWNNRKEAGHLGRYKRGDFLEDFQDRTGKPITENEFRRHLTEYNKARKKP